MEDPARPAVPRILSVGQCGVDHMSIAEFFADLFQARVDRAHDSVDARAALGTNHYSLVLVNRVLDRDGSSGLDLIRALKNDPDTGVVPVMLVSDHAEAQQAARALGAAPGFGKRTLYSRETRERIKRALEES
ncbi:MAG: hypothetical protein ACP5XB_26615 [Isosphaeraceae bacterium]